MGICMGKLSSTETRSAQTDINSYCDFVNIDFINPYYQNCRPTSTHSRSYNQKSCLDNINLKNSLINDWKHSHRYDYNFTRSDNQCSDNCSPVLSNIARQKYFHEKDNKDVTKTPGGVWPINGSGDYNLINLKKKKNMISQSRMQINRNFEKSNANLNVLFTDDDDNLTQRNNFFNDINEELEQQCHSKHPNPMAPDHQIKKLNRKVSARRNRKFKDLNKMKSSTNFSNQDIKSGNNNSINFPIGVDDKLVNNSVCSPQKFQSSNLLIQDFYPIQYTFYVDDNDICIKPFYDRRMVAIAKTCRCRIYFHAKADCSEKPLYYKGKPVRPVTITSPDMVCLKRCLGSIDSQFPYFNCKAFLSLSS